MNNCCIRALKLLTRVFGCGWLECKRSPGLRKKLRLDFSGGFPASSKTSIFIEEVWFQSANRGWAFLEPFKENVCRGLSCLPLISEQFNAKLGEVAEKLSPWIRLRQNMRATEKFHRRHNSKSEILTKNAFLGFAVGAGCYLLAMSLQRMRPGEKWPRFLEKLRELTREILHSKRVRLPGGSGDRLDFSLLRGAGNGHDLDCCWLRFWLAFRLARAWRGMAGEVKQTWSFAGWLMLILTALTWRIAGVFLIALAT